MQRVYIEATEHAEIVAKKDNEIKVLKELLEVWLFYHQREKSCSIVERTRDILRIK